MRSDTALTNMEAVCKMLVLNLKNSIINWWTILSGGWIVYYIFITVLDNLAFSPSIIMRSFLTLLPVIFLTALGSPTAEDFSKRDDRGSETVTGISVHKKAILNAGGNTLDLAIAMLEM